MAHAPWRCFTGHMDSTEETKAVAEVAERLLRRFPHLPKQTVDDLVGQVHAQFEGRPIRDFVPVLVENIARSRLSALPVTRQASVDA